LFRKSLYSHVDGAVCEGSTAEVGLAMAFAVWVTSMRCWFSLKPRLMEDISKALTTSA
jgi:hypothetical protein